MMMLEEISFEDIYTEKRKKPVVYLKGLDKMSVLIILGLINGRVTNNRILNLNQHSFFLYLLNSLHEPTAKRLFDSMFRLDSAKARRVLQNEVALFSSHHLVKLMLLTLSIPQDSADESSNWFNSKETYLNQILKAYFSLVSSQHEKANSGRSISDNNSDYESLRNLFWPTLIQQYEYMVGASLRAQIVKGFYFLDYISKSKYSKYLDEFLTKHGHNSFVTFHADLIRLVKHLKDSSQENEEFRPNTTIKDQINLLSDYTIEADNIHQIKGESINDLKSKPILKFKNGTLIILHFDFLIDKLYQGLIFDLFYKTSFKNNHSPKELYSQIGYFTDKHCFKHIFNALLKKEFPKVWEEPENSTHKGLPDYYLRNGNNIIIIEVKNVTLKNELIDQGDLFLIQNEILKKVASFGRGAKGVGQILNSIIKFDKKEFIPESTDNIKYKNLKIFPVVVHSNDYLTMHGVNKLVNREFQKALSDLTLNLSNINKEHIQPPVLVHIDFFLEEYPVLMRKKATRFLNLLRNYTKKIKRGEKQTYLSKNQDKVISEHFEDFRYSVNIENTTPYPVNILEKLKVKEIIDEASERKNSTNTF